MKHRILFSASLFHAVNDAAALSGAAFLYYLLPGQKESIGRA